MKPPVDEVRISARGKDILLKLKRKTGLKHWNELCRIAFCLSLKQASEPSRPKAGEAGIRMDWKTFAGAHSDVFIALNLLRSTHDDLIDDDSYPLSEQFRAHLERGITILSEVSDLRELASIATTD